MAATLDPGVPALVYCAGATHYVEPAPDGGLETISAEQGPTPMSSSLWSGPGSRVEYWWLDTSNPEPKPKDRRGECIVIIQSSPSVPGDAQLEPMTSSSSAAAASAVATAAHLSRHACSSSASSTRRSDLDNGRRAVSRRLGPGPGFGSRSVSVDGVHPTVFSL